MLSHRREFLRHAVQLGLTAALGSSLGQIVTASAPRRAKLPRPRPLIAVADATTGKQLMRLPEGFRYFSFGWAGEALEGGGKIPGAADGMGVVAINGNRLTFIRNQELADTNGAFAPGSDAYDPRCGGGCVRLELDLAAEKLISAQAALTGTMVNCSGGTTSWNSWLSCEEIVFGTEQIGVRLPSMSKREITRPHGLVFEVTASGPAQARPIEDMGLFRHEAVALDTRDGTLYLTEDREPESGFYRFTPRTPGQLQHGGKLEMLKAKGRTDLRRGVRVGQQWEVGWVPIDKPMQGHMPGTTDSGGVIGQGIVAHGARFMRLEGCLAHHDGIWFTSTSGGDAGRGQVWRLDPRANLLELMFEATLENGLDYPDNLCDSPGSAVNRSQSQTAGMIICEDNQREPNERLRWLGRDGRMLTLAENITEIDGTSYGPAEWAGCCISPDGKWLFVNLYSPGCSVAITGPWDEWLQESA